MKKIPITALCGFLGSGKTTLLRRWRHEESLSDAAVIVHDFSEFGVDAELLAKEEMTPVAGRLEGRVAALHGKHARELLYPSLGTTLGDIAALDVPAPHVLCESTGAARPWPLIEALTQDRRFFLRHFIVTVDCLNLHRDFADGRVLTGEANVLQDPSLQRAAEILAEQILFASIIILTKIDTLPEAVVKAQVQLLQRLMPGVAIGLSAHAGLLLHQLEGTPAPKLSDLKSRARKFGLTNRAPTPEGMTSLVIRARRPFHPKRLYEICQRELATGLYRTKGFLWLASRPGHVLLWQQSGSQIGFEATGFWRADAANNLDGMLLPEEVDGLNAKLESQHPVFGDRRNELTLIGEEGACTAFRAALERALCTDEEVQAWLAGDEFEDPWPQSARRVDY